MALLTAYTPGGAGGATDGSIKWAVVALRNVTANDTFDVAVLNFVKVNGAMFAASTNRTATPTVAGIAGTVLTLAGTGIAGDSGYLFVFGE